MRAEYNFNSTKIKDLAYKVDFEERKIFIMFMITIMMRFIFNEYEFENTCVFNINKVNKYAEINKASTLFQLIIELCFRKKGWGKDNFLVSKLNVQRRFFSSNITSSISYSNSIRNVYEKYEIAEFIKTLQNTLNINTMKNKGHTVTFHQRAKR